MKAAVWRSPAAPADRAAGSLAGQVHEPQHAEAEDHECGDARAEGRTDTEGRDQETAAGAQTSIEVLHGR